MPGMPPLFAPSVAVSSNSCAAAGGARCDSGGVDAPEAAADAAEPSLSVAGDVSSGDGCTLLP